MNKMLGLLITAGLIFIVSAAWAGLPSINTGSSTTNTVVNKGLDTAKNKAIEDDINKKIAAFNCAFKKGTTNPTCDLQKVYDLIKSKKAPFEALGLASVYVRVKASSYDRANYAEDFGENVLGNWWKISSSTNSAIGDKLEITVKSY